VKALSHERGVVAVRCVWCGDDTLAYSGWRHGNGGLGTERTVAMEGGGGVGEKEEEEGEKGDDDDDDKRQHYVYCIRHQQEVNKRPIFIAVNDTLFY